MAEQEIKSSALENWFNKNICFGNDDCHRKVDNLFAVWVKNPADVTNRKDFDKRRIPEAGSVWAEKSCLFLTNIDKAVLSHLADQNRIQFKCYQIRKQTSYEDMHRNNWCGDSTHVIAMEAGLPYDKNHNRNRKVAESIKFLESIGLVISRQPQDGKNLCTRVPARRLAMVNELPDTNRVNYLMLYHTEGCDLKYVFEDRACFLKWVEENRVCGYSQLPYPEHHIDTDVRLWYPYYD